MSKELRDMRNKFILCCVIAIVILTVGLLMVFNRFGDQKSKIEKAIDNKNSFVIYFVSNKCDKCDMVETVLNSNNLKYYKYDINGSDISNILTKLKITFDIEAPSLVVVENGTMTYNIIGIDSKESVVSFIDSYGLKSFSKN